MKYLIHDASQLVGIAPQTIRYYEKLGIISESRDKYSGYRFFDTLDISILMRSRNYRGWHIFVLAGAVLHWWAVWFLG